jgi:subtilisin family serine protease
VVCGSDYLNPAIKAGGAHKGDDFHGSMVTGIIAGQANANAPGGIAPKAKVISIDNTDGNTEGLLSAMEWILEIKKKYNVVALSASIGAPNSSGVRGGSGDCSPGSELEKKINNLIAAGINVIFAAGNDGSFTKISFPACLPSVISVGALTYKGEIAEYSNVTKSITVMAPADIKSSNGSSGYFIGGGTSSATPVVAGAVALLKQAKPDATTDEIRKALQTSRTTVNDIVWGNLPVLDIPRAIEAIKSGVFDPNVVINVNASSLSELKIAKDAQTKAENEAKLAKEAQIRAEANVKLAREELAQALVELNKWKPASITCARGTRTKIVTAVNPKCPAGYIKK